MHVQISKAVVGPQGKTNRKMQAITNRETKNIQNVMLTDLENWGLQGNEYIVSLFYAFLFSLYYAFLLFMNEVLYEIWLLYHDIINIFFFFFFFSSCSVYYRYIYVTYILQIKNMKLLRVGAPSIHTSLKLILAGKKTKNKDYLISYNVISATKYVSPDPKSYSLPAKAS